MSRPRFHLPGACEGALLALPEPTARHARLVLRLRAGDELRVFDGRGHEWQARLEAVSPGRTLLRVGAPAEPRHESPLRITLALAPLKGERLEWALQKAVELGVWRFEPVVTARTESAARAALRGARDERWRRVVIAAAEQCGRARVPEVAPAVAFAAWLAAPAPGLRLLFSERPGAAPLPLALQETPLGAGDEVRALIGPEGGFDGSELEQARAAGVHEVGLGPRVLRAETAALAAVVALQVLCGDLSASVSPGGGPT